MINKLHLLREYIQVLEENGLISEMNISEDSILHTKTI